MNSFAMPIVNEDDALNVFGMRFSSCLSRKGGRIDASVHDRLVSLDGTIDLEPTVTCPFAYQDFVSVPRKHNRVVVIGPKHDFAFKTAKSDSLSAKSFEMRTGIAIVFSYTLNEAA
jgi:hypothetical protein